MSLSLTTRRRIQSSSSKWTSQQHLAQQEPLLRQHLAQPMRKQRSFIEPTPKLQSYTSASGRRSYFQRGLSVGRPHDTPQHNYAGQFLKKQTTLTDQQHCNGGKIGEGGKSLKSQTLIQRNITACGRIDHRSSRTLQTWSSTSSILKSLDKELAQLNGVLGKAKDIKNDCGGGSECSTNLVNKNNSKTKNSTGPQTTTAANPLSSKVHKSVNSTSFTKTEHNKVNLSIVLSHALSDSREPDSLLSDPAEGEESDTPFAECEQIRDLNSKSKEAACKPVPAQQRRILYQATKGAALSNATSTANSSYTTTSGSQNSNNFNASPSLTIQKRPPLVRAMSAPVRSFDDNSKGSFLANKRKTRRRKLNARTITCDKESEEHMLNVKDLNLDSKQKVLQRSRSVAPDVITLVSLISSEGSDSEKEDCSSTPTNSDSNSPARRAPTLRKSGKSVSFQENYPPTFQFASKEYSHMLRRGSIAPLAARIKSNRPPTAPSVSIFYTTTSNNNTSKTVMDQQESHDPVDDNNKGPCCPAATTMPSAKKLEEEETYHYPDYVRGLKERECWKLFQKMSTKGVNITYETILRGMLTPTEFRQVQKQREIEEAKALKESEELAALNEEQQKPKAKSAGTLDR